MAVGDVVQGPTQTGLTLDTAQKPAGRLNSLLADPNFQSILAGIGARLDPTGVGGALGGATQEYLKSQAAQRAATALTNRNAPPTKNPNLTPEGVPGPTSHTVTTNSDGTYTTTTKGDSAKEDVSEENATPLAPSETNINTPVAPPAQTRTSKVDQEVSKLPFILAPSQDTLGDIRGMSAEQVPSILEAYHRGEELRQKNVGQILSAYKDESEAGKTGADDLATQQAKNLAAITQGLPAGQAANTALQNAQAVESLQRAAENKNMSPLKQDQLRQQIDQLALNAPLARQHLEAQTSALQTSTEKEKLSIENDRALGTLPKQVLEEKLKQAKSANETVEFDIAPSALTPGGKVNITSQQLLDYIEKGSTIDRANQKHEDTVQYQKERNEIAAKNHADILKHQQEQTRLASEAHEDKATATASKAESFILDAKFSTNPAIQGHIDDFNAHSTKPYIYNFNKSTHWFKSDNGESKAYTIPKINQKGTVIQYNARQVTAEASKLGLTPKEYIDKIMAKYVVK
jgi:hypothetical protein